MTDFPAFPGFRQEAYDFMRMLAENNDRDWFKANKTTFDDEVKWPMQCLLADINRAAPATGLPIKGNPKKGIYRIYRDVRFSKNKNPYKTHMDALVSRDGTRKVTGAFFIRMMPDANMLGAGFWMPDNKILGRWRDRMREDLDGFQNLLDKLQANGLTLETFGKPLKRMPRGYNELQDHALADYFKWKGYVISVDVADEEFMSPDFTHRFLDFAKKAHPLLEYGWEIIDDM